MVRRAFCTAALAAAAGCRRAVPAIRAGITPGMAGAASDLKSTYGEHVVLTVNPPALLIKEMEAGELDTVYLGPGAYGYLWTRTGGQVEPVIASLNTEGKPYYNSIVVVPVNSPFQTVADLRNRVIVFVDRLSTSGYLAPRVHLRQEGYGSNFFAETRFAGTHERALQMVVAGDADAAASWWFSDEQNALLAFESLKKVPVGSLRVVWASPPLPSPAWIVRTGTNRVREVLLQVARDRPKHWAASSHKSYTPMLYLPGEAR